MADKDYNDKNSHEEIYSKSLRAGRRTYFFDVRETRAGDYYLTITESKKNSNEDGSFYFKKHKIYLYKEDFNNFKDYLNDTTEYIMREKGEEVISDRHQSNYDENSHQSDKTSEQVEPSNNQEDSDLDKFTDISFDDI